MPVTKPLTGQEILDHFNSMTLAEQKRVLAAEDVCCIREYISCEMLMRASCEFWGCRPTECWCNIDDLPEAIGDAIFDEWECYCEDLEALTGTKDPEPESH